MAGRARRVLPFAVAVVGLLGLIAAVAEVVRIDMERAASHRMFLPDDAPPREVVIVLGAPVGELLSHRMDAACALIARGAAQRMVLTGMPAELPSMQERALRCLAADHVLVDDQAARTFDNVRNARMRFGIARALIVTQRFHLPRALALADAVGIEAVGVIAAGEPRWSTRVREHLARVRALVDR